MLPAAYLGSKYPPTAERELGCVIDRQEDTLLPGAVQSAKEVVEQTWSKVEDQADPSEEVLLAVAERLAPDQEQVHRAMEHTDWVLPVVGVELVVHKGL